MGTFSAWMATAIDVVALLTVVTTVKELTSGNALALTFKLGTALLLLLLTGPLMGAVTVVTAGQPHFDILPPWPCTTCVVITSVCLLYCTSMDYQNSVPLHI